MGIRRRKLERTQIVGEAARLSAVSLFSGAGGMDYGFERAGFEIVAANEIDRDAIETYERNFPDSVRLIPQSIDDPAVMRSLQAYAHIDLVFGGPPCQGFSVAGKMDPDDPRSRLLWKFFDVVDALRPRAFVCENVSALSKNSRWRKLRRALFSRASKLGYECSMFTLNANDYGVPQSRERMFFIGVFTEHRKLYGRLTLKEELSSRLEWQLRTSETLGDIVRRLGPAGELANPRICKAKVTFARNPVLRRSPYAGMLFNGAGRPIRPTWYSATLPASMGGNKTPIVDEDEIFQGKNSYVEAYHAHLIRGGRPRWGTAPSRLRRLTIDECLAVQTFPTDFELAGTQSSAYRQIGNAVPCLLAESVARSVKNVLLGEQVWESTAEAYVAA